MTYVQNISPIVNAITPNMGPTIGGTTVEIDGSGFGSNSANVIILFDNILCSILSINNTLILCVTG